MQNYHYLCGIKQELLGIFHITVIKNFMMKKLFILLMTMMEVVQLQAQDELTMLVGTYTDGGSKGVYSFHFNQQTGVSRLLDSLGMRNPSYLTIAAQGRTVYAVSETGDEQASIGIIRLNPATGSMRLLSSALTLGEDPCYVATNGMLAVTANYSGGSMSVFRLGQNGTQAELVSRFLGSKGGPDLSRQDVAHVHCACFTPDGKYLLATDFSADRILSYRVDRYKTVANGVASKVSAGSGPRHIVFSRDGRFAYLMSELSGEVTVFGYHEGRLTPVQEIVSDSVGARGGADIHLSPDGRFLYSSNRLKAEGIAIFSVDSVTGRLERIGYQPTAAHPRQFNITPNGRYLLCCCRDSGKIQVFLRDPKTGLLTDIRQDIFLSKPVCVKLVDSPVLYPSVYP